jgi:hypothetical protein
MELDERDWTRWRRFHRRDRSDRTFVAGIQQVAIIVSKSVTDPEILGGEIPTLVVPPDPPPRS